MSYYGEQPHFLEACFLCRKPLGYNSDIFMYRGNTPFCSKECRQEQIDMDDYSSSRKKNNSTTTSRRSIRNSDPQDNSTPVRPGTVAVA